MFIEDAYCMNLRFELCDLDMTPFSAVYFPSSHSIVSVQTALPASNNKLDRASGKVMTSSIHTYIHTYIHSLFDNAGYRIGKTEVVMWTCLSTI